MATDNMFKTIDEYIENQDPAVQPLLQQVRRIIRDAIPDAEERMSWQMPTFWRGQNLIHFAVQKKHLGIYPGPEAVEHFASLLDKNGYKYSKGAIQFPYDRISLDLIRQIAEFCGKH